MKVEIELKSDCIKVNGFEIYTEPKVDASNNPYTVFEVRWKESLVATFDDDLSEAIKYCLV